MVLFDPAVSLVRICAEREHCLRPAFLLSLAVAGFDKQSLQGMG